MAQQSSSRAQSKVQVINRQKQLKIDGKAVARFCRALLQALNQADRHVTIVFVGIQSMRMLNRHHLNRDYATDVLSFSYQVMMIEGAAFLGEVVVCPEVALRHALHYRADPQKELRKLLIHGILHLLGYDHERDGGAMKRLEAGLLRRKFFQPEASLIDLRKHR